MIDTENISKCTFIGLNAGADVTTGIELVILGDNIRTFDPDDPNVLIQVGDKILIGHHIFRIPIIEVLRNLQKVL